LKGRPSYERTAEHRAKMTQALTGKRHSYRSASTRPEVAAKIAAAWTPERRQEARLKGLAWAETVRKGWKRARALARQRAAGHCEQCGGTTNLDTHHKDFSKTNHDPANLIVLCRSCHKLAHYGRSPIGAARPR
jgi:5-methylcytosine-specific restriction endonuclease McrA